jgi:hypothetical protein
MVVVEEYFLLGLRDLVNCVMLVRKMGLRKSYINRCPFNGRQTFIFQF